jgi:DNA-binding NarL/FixJ family response regulator
MDRRMVKILIVEDQIMLKESLEYLINGQGDMKVVGTTEDAADAPELCRKLKPDMILMDVVTKNNSNGIAYTAQIHKEFPAIKIVVMTGLPDITFSEEARKAGAHSFIDKNVENEHLFHVIRSTMKGLSIYSGHAAQQLFAAQFTEKEIAVIRLVCQGMTRDEIAKKLDVSESMIKQHITSILDKTGFDSISKFAIYAVGQNLIVPLTTDVL